MTLVTTPFPEGSATERIGLNYPKESGYTICELPVRKGKRGYQVWNGEKWLPIKFVKVS